LEERKRDWEGEIREIVKKREGDFFFKNKKGDPKKRKELN